jgi:hypothetical protein
MDLAVVYLYNYVNDLINHWCLLYCWINRAKFKSSIFNRAPDLNHKLYGYDQVTHVLTRK